MQKVLILKWEIYKGWVALCEGYIDKETESHFHKKGFNGKWYKKENKLTAGYRYETINFK